MINDFEFIKNNISNFFKDLIGDYNLNFVKINNDAIIFIYKGCAFKIFIHSYYGTRLFYNYKDNITNNYYSIAPESYIKSLMNKEERIKNIENGKINVVNEDYHKFVSCLSSRIKLCIRLYEIKEVVQYILINMSTCGNSWLDDYYKYFSLDDKVQIYGTELEFYSKYF